MNNTHETYVSLEIAKLLKEAGFDWQCIRYYQNNNDILLGPLVEQYKLVCTNFNVAPIYMEQYNAPTLAVAQKWLREVKGIEIEVQRYGYPHSLAIELLESVYDKKVERGFAYSVNILNENDESLYDEQGFQTYESALEAGIKKCLEKILEENK